ncbi:MAG TPA: elongation factor Ts, partial [Gammaproteobacteria bacterium]|nr:elongation factor Ts [Gammaproteobacteria bacterium]
KALSESEGDMDKAIEQMRIAGLAKADKKSDRTAAEGIVVITLSDDEKNVSMVEINSETDFVAKGDDFRGFADAVGAAALANTPADLDALNAGEI